jgi:predicted DNA-binding transcriptional regulator AlpA
MSLVHQKSSNHRRINMTKKPSRVRILMMPYQDDDGKDPVAYSGPATVLTGLPRTIRRHELKLIVPLADSTIYDMEKRGEFPRRFNITPRCVVWDLEEVEAWLEHRRRIYLEGRAKIARGPDVRQRKTRPVKAHRADM